VNQPHRQRIGKWGEATAAWYLQARGYRIMGRNIRTPHGEIDLIASQGAGLIFVEVKTRTNLSYGLPELAVTPRKLVHMVDSAQFYMEEHPELARQGWQIDVVAICGRPGDAREHVDIQHFQNVAS
jgi:putative endonuclease